MLIKLPTSFDGTSVAVTSTTSARQILVLASLLMLFSCHLTPVSIYGPDKLFLAAQVGWSYPTYSESPVGQMETYDNGAEEMKHKRSEIRWRLAKLSEQRAHRPRRVDSNSSVQCVNQWELDRQEMKDLDALYRQTDAASTPQELAQADDEGDAASVTRSQDLRACRLT
ncbi:hypothetical protein GUITHDRAFT_148416 [Guillardia theta CCMP2712]|uniref:Uncharacterized protein n=1 Tax=Guillardia theta (strain CCMP2712) TaxID=905079 RepID=L1I9G7_GUITC|nr:hypothetical protein GUITHDRAFT_148416 [Guillardia theta CCMP2712]EKX32742.1 hypothetical protein GUITHDRAFT_148416 [Guillardia theta CCMP2712]|eukprot:XP_005819722.1 hypothetical protein GUITHDRAFT_148416 [Guillardia theta CCMP2712]